ncbi:hypothetical protein BDR05DRAFT_79484 [Suillus weaverae]|nr:hypothetical protein BDR05DRAFT_79484 [Suillus weaverae]
MTDYLRIDITSGTSLRHRSPLFLPPSVPVTLSSRPFFLYNHRPLYNCPGHLADQSCLATTGSRPRLETCLASQRSHHPYPMLEQ